MIVHVSSRLLAAQSDERLVALVREGHEHAFEAVVQRYRRPLLRYCGRIGLSETRGEDAVQHALLQAWLALARGAEVRDLRPWLYRIAHNAAVNALRSTPCDNGPLADAASVPDSSAAAESALERSIAVRDALTEVAALPQLQREAILLTAVDGRTHEEVASVLGVSHGAVRGLLYRARTTLRAAAAAITPQPLISWASGCVGRTAPTAERIAVLCTPGGPAGMTGTLLKGGAMMVTAAVFVAGAAVVPLQRHGAHRPRHIMSSAGRSGAPVRSHTGAVLSASPGTGAGAVAVSGARQNIARTPTRTGKPGGGRARVVSSGGAGPSRAPAVDLASPGAGLRQGGAGAGGLGSADTGSQGPREGDGATGVVTSPAEGAPSGGSAQPRGAGAGGSDSGSGSPGQGPGSGDSEGSRGAGEGSGDGLGDGGGSSDGGGSTGGGSTGGGGESDRGQSGADHSGADSANVGSAEASTEHGD